MTKVVIYNQDNGVPSVLTPTAECLKTHSILEIAVKDVPSGKPFAIVELSDLPDAPQDAWIVGEADLTDGVGGESNAFS